MPTLLHISDLHRTSKPRLSNDELLAAIVSDATRWESEGVPQPELIVVSGDLVQKAQKQALPILTPKLQPNIVKLAIS